MLFGRGFVALSSTCFITPTTTRTRSYKTFFSVSIYATVKYQPIGEA